MFLKIEDDDFLSKGLVNIDMVEAFWPETLKKTIHDPNNGIKYVDVDVTAFRYSPYSTRSDFGDEDTRRNATRYLDIPYNDFVDFLSNINKIKTFVVDLPKRK